MPSSHDLVPPSVTTAAAVERAPELPPWQRWPRADHSRVAAGVARSGPVQARTRSGGSAMTSEAVVRLTYRGCAALGTHAARPAQRPVSAGRGASAPDRRHLKVQVLTRRRRSPDRVPGLLNGPTPSSPSRSSRARFSPLAGGRAPSSSPAPPPRASRRTVRAPASGTQWRGAAPRTPSPPPGPSPC